MMGTQLHCQTMEIRPHLGDDHAVKSAPLPGLI
jgi:hypothetical protein